MPALSISPMSALLDAMTVRRETGDEDADFEARVAESERRVVRIAWSVLGDAHDAEEVAQEAFWRAYRRFGSLRDPRKFRAWVSRIAFRLALNRLRARRRRLLRDTAWYESRPGGDREATEILDRLFLDRVRAEIEELPEKLRAVLLLCAVEDLDAAEAAAILGIPAGTVRSRLHLARKRLLERMSR